MSQGAPLAVAGPASDGPVDYVRRHPGLVLIALLLGTGLALGVAEGWRELGQVTINGVVAGNYFALGAVGLTLIFGVLRLVNFAHGEFLTFGAYMLIVGNAVGLPLVVSVAFGVAATAVLGVVLEVSLWRPVRRKRVGELQLLLLALGLAFFMRNAIAFVAGPQDRASGANTTASVQVGEFRIGRTELIVTLVGLSVIVLVAVALKYSSLGRQARALADSIQLSETTGIDTDRVVLITWAASAGLAGLAGILYALPAGVVNPNLGFSLILSIFAAVVVGGIGNAYGALAGGLLIGLVQEWSTLVIDPAMKVAVGFAVLILVLLIRPQGLFGRGGRWTDEWCGGRRRLVRVPPECRLLDQCRGARNDLRRVLAGNPAERRHNRDLQLRPGWLHGRRLLRDGRPRCQVWRLVLACARLGIGVGVAAGLLVGLPSLRLRADYFAISTLAFSEIVRYVADDWDGLTGGNLGLFGYTDAWRKRLRGSTAGWSGSGSRRNSCCRCCSSTSRCFSGSTALVALLVQSPWGRVLKAIREDEDAARALGKNTFVYKLQSLSIAAALASIAGYMLAINISILSPRTSIRS